MGSGDVKGVQVVHDYKRTKDSIVKLRDMLEQTLWNVSALQDSSDSSGVMVSSLSDLHTIITSDCATIVRAMTRVLHALTELARDVSNTAKKNESEESNNA